MTDRARNKIPAALTGIAACFLSGNAIAQDDASGSDAIEEVVVTGIRGSLMQAIDQKRNSNKVVDGITAEDIGKFPDENLAESLQRITGVSISRDNGEGSRVSVRGLSPDLTFVTVNGQSISSATGGRDFDFQLFSSDLIGGVEVIKSPTADIDEGGVGGTVNILTPNPLDIGDRRLAFGIKGNYEDLAGEWSPRVSATYSDLNLDGSFGWLISASYQERNLRQDTLNINGWTSDPNQNSDIDDFDVDGDGIITAPESDFNGDAMPNDIFAPRNVRMGLFEQERERIGFNTTLQWRPSDKSEIYVRGAYTEFDVDSSSQQVPMRLFRSRTRNDIPAFTNITIDGDTIVAADLNDPEIRIRQVSETIKNDVYLISAGFAHEPDDHWRISGDITTSEANRDLERFEPSWQVRSATSYSVSGTDPRNFSIDPEVDLSDATQFPFDRLQIEPEQVEDQQFSGQLDAERFFDDSGAFSGIKFGAKYRTRDNNFDIQNQQLRGAPFDTLLFSDFTISFPASGFLSGFNGLPTNYAAGNGKAIVVAARDLNGGAFDPAELPLETGGVEEDTTAAYVMADFNGTAGNTPFRANIGVRSIKTDQTSTGFEVTEAGTSAISSSRDYTDTLFSGNIAFDMTDDLVLRFALANVMTRPTLSDLRLSTQIEESQQTAFISNPDLDPFRADQADASVEWYFAPGGLLSVAFFYKDIESFITQVTETGVDLGLDVTGPIAGQPDGINDPFIVTTVVNGDGAKVKGVEFSVQGNFDFLPEPFNGLGGIANYTYTDSETSFENQLTGAPLSLPGQSENTINLSTYFETERFALRLSYNWRDEFVAVPVGVSGLPTFTRDYGQLDFSSSYNVNDSLTVTLEAINLTNEKLVQEAGAALRVFDYQETGARYFLGARFQF